MSDSLILWISGALFTLTTGSYAYTFLASKSSAKTDDIQSMKDQIGRIENRVDKIYEHLIKRSE